MTTNNLKERFIASINDNDCGHHHRDYESAEKCVRQTIRRAKRGEVFYGSDFAKRLNLNNEVAIWIKRRLIAR